MILWTLKYYLNVEFVEINEFSWLFKNIVVEKMGFSPYFFKSKDLKKKPMILWTLKYLKVEFIENFLGCLKYRN